MREMDTQTFVSFMKIVAVICVIAMVVSVWPVSDDDRDDE
jgi:hypothetical protein